MTAHEVRQVLTQRPALRHVIMRTLGLATRVSGVGALALLAAQEAIAQAPNFRAGTTLVEVSAIVTRAGVPVTDLRAEEVTVFDEGRVQPLVAFELVDLTTWEGLAERRDYVVVTDRHISPRLTKATREVARTFIGALSPHDRLAVVNTGAKELVQQLSTDRAVSEALVERVSGERIGLLRAMQFESDALTTLEVLRRVAAVLEREGTSERRAVVLVSEVRAAIADRVGGLRTVDGGR